MKKLIAYSSIAHMGFVTLGMFIGFQIVAQYRQNQRQLQWHGWGQWYKCCRMAWYPAPCFCASA